MAKTFGVAEHFILNLFSAGTTFQFRGMKYTVICSGKPTCRKGEPKTDIYIAAQNIHHDIEEIKISFKKANADFLENKITDERAEQILGADWAEIIAYATSKLSPAFSERPLIFKHQCGKTEQGAITLGWKFELLNVGSGQLSGNMYLTREQVIDVYAGTNLTSDKRDACVNTVKIPNSGIANYILLENQPVYSAQDAIDSLMTIEDYVDEHPNVYFACKALNYRTFAEKYDGNRPLAVYVDWFVTNGKLDYKLCFDTPLQQGGDYAYHRLFEALRQLEANDTDDLNDSNVRNPGIIN
ncbi:MAG: hypothetical protein J6A19_11600 [Oscillospiraceae bacterium]|nr:hypothetical protein [Oscillospiraceae bacterium]